MTYRLPYTAAERQQVLDRMYPLPPDPRFYQRVIEATKANLLSPQTLLIDFGLHLLWPFAMVVVLLCFRGSMQRGQVRPTQLLRCAVYCGDSVIGYVVLRILILLVACMGVFTIGPERSNWRAFDWAYSHAFWCLWGFQTWRLGRALGVYLGLERAMGLAIASQVLLPLLVFAGVPIVIRMILG